MKPQLFGGIIMYAGIRSEGGGGLERGHAPDSRELLHGRSLKILFLKSGGTNAQQNHTP